MSDHLASLRVAAFVSAFLLSHPALSARAVMDGRAVFTAGNWTLYKGKDTMTDQTTCTGVYKQDANIQLVGHALYVGVRGGVSSVTLRFGETPARPMRLAEKSEKQLDAAVLRGSEFAEALKYDRLRVQVLTLVRGLVDHDLNTAGIEDAVYMINAGCPDTAISTVKVEAPQVLCSDLLTSRMKAAGLNDTTIATICTK